MISVKQANSSILIINGGSASIKFALFDVDHKLKRILAGSIERIGLPKATFVVKGSNKADIDKHGEDMPEIRNWQWMAALYEKRIVPSQEKVNP